MKLKVKPSLRVKRRYLLIEGKKEDIEKALLDYLGILGWAKASPFFVRGDVLAINREEIEQVRAAFEVCRENIKIKKVSGTLKGLGNKR